MAFAKSDPGQSHPEYRKGPAVSRSNSIAIFLQAALVCVMMACGSAAFGGSLHVAHVYVALCDNANQGIVPVPEFLGNGQDPGNNLYWGAMYGVKTFFRGSDEWELKTSVYNPCKSVLERCVFKHTDGAYLVADAFDVSRIKDAVTQFLRSVSGHDVDTIVIDSHAVVVGGGASLAAYVGHNGLMDFQLQNYPQAADSVRRDAIILACVSKGYFEEAIEQAGARPLLWTMGLMAPEAYTLHAALREWLRGADGEAVRAAAAEAYSRYQKCSLRASRKLLVTGAGQ